PCGRPGHRAARRRAVPAAHDDLVRDDTYFSVLRRFTSGHDSFAPSIGSLSSTLPVCSLITALEYPSGISPFFTSAILLSPPFCVVTFVQNQPRSNPCIHDASADRCCSLT